MACSIYVFLAVSFTTNYLLSPLTYPYLNLIPESVTPWTSDLYSLLSTLPWKDDYDTSLDLGFSSGSSATGSISHPPSYSSLLSLNGSSTFTKHTEDVIYWDPHYDFLAKGRFSMSHFLSSKNRKKNLPLYSSLAPHTKTRVNGKLTSRSGPGLRAVKGEGDTSMPASLFLSKAFSVSHENLAYMNQPNLDIVPYYYRSNSEHEKEDITITTLVTRNRFEIFKQLVERYQGPISVTVHVSRAEILGANTGLMTSTTSSYLSPEPSSRSSEDKQSGGDQKEGEKKSVMQDSDHFSSLLGQRKQDAKLKSEANLGSNVEITTQSRTKPKLELGSKTGEVQEPNFLDALHALYTSTPLMSQYVDVHLVMTPGAGDRQFNAWRNVARFFARTEYVMMLDVDFVPCTDFRSRVREALKGKGGWGSAVRKGGKGGHGSDRHDKKGKGKGRGKEEGEEVTIQDLLRAGLAALVIPAFEYTNHEDGYDVSKFPRTKEEVRGMYERGEIGMFHRSWEYGHNGTDYERWVFGERKEGEVYKVRGEDYQYAYEPYVIFRREGLGLGTISGTGAAASSSSLIPRMIPWCDERFVGYGGNKAACLYEMYLSGVDFYVLGDDFLVHRSHGYDESARRVERRYNRRIYRDFREEVCLRYLYSSLKGGMGLSKKEEDVRRRPDTLDGLRGRRARNVIEECKKMKGVARIIAMVSFYYYQSSLYGIL